MTTRDPSTSLISYLVEQTGFPESVITADATLGQFLGLRGGRLCQILADLEESAGTKGLSTWLRALRPEEQTVGRLADRLSATGTPLESRPAPRSVPSFRRMILRTVEEPLPRDAPASPPVSTALLIGRAPAVEPLAERFRTAGGQVQRIPWSDDPAQLAEALDAGGPDAPPASLCFLIDASEWPRPGDNRLWDFVATRRMTAVFAACRRWLDRIAQAGLVESASLVAVTSLGGDFGLRLPIGDPSGGGFAGLFKALRAETGNRLTVKVLDAAAGEPAKMVAAAVWRELAARLPEVEVGCVRSRREVVRCIPQSAEWRPRRAITPGGAWIVAGDAGEQLTHAAAAIARRYGAALHRIGTGTGRRLSEVLALEPSSATSHVGDLSDRDSLAPLLTRIREASGPIRGVLHAADAIDSNALASGANAAEAAPRRAIAPRVEAAAALLELTRDDPLEAFVLIGSLGARFGSSQHTAHSMATDLAAKVVAVEARRRSGPRLVTIHWPERMPAAEGLAHLIAEIETAGDDSEVVLVDLDSSQHTHPALPCPAAASAMADCNQSSGSAPLIDSIFLRSNGSAVGSITFDPTADPFLTSHRDAGVPLLPAVMVIESACELACLAAGLPHVGEVRDVKLIQGFRMPLAVKHRADVLAERVPLPAGAPGPFAYECRLAGNFYTEEGRLADPARVFQSLTVIPTTAPAELTLPPDAATPDCWVPIRYSDDWRQPTRTIFNGRVLSTLKEVAYDQPEGSGDVARPATSERRPIAQAWGRLVAPHPQELAGHRTGTAWRTPPSLHDGLLLGVDLFCYHLYEGRQLPQAIERIRFGRMPRAGEHCLSRTLCYGRDGRQFVFDLWLLGQNGDVLIEATGVRFVDLNVVVSARS